MGEPKDNNIFKLSIRKNSFTIDIKNLDPNKILRIKTMMVSNYSQNCIE
jgi:hypothetical protein